MIYIAAFWYFVIGFFAAYIGSVFFKSKKLKSFLEDKGILFFIIAASLVLMGIITKDPVTVFGINIPTELQWLSSLLVTGFGAWRFYLNPLKSKVYSLDREVGEIKTDMTNIKSDINLIKRKLIGAKA